MSTKSLQIKLNSQTSNDDNRGGEKKVMKKSLSVLVATAMVSSMFASVAFAADTLTTQQKLDELIKLKIFDPDGTGNGSELDAKMSREQLAKIVAKLKGLNEVSGTTYTDVASDRWSAGFIQAVSKTSPLIMDGVAEGIFDPAGDVTLEMLATVAVRALGLQPNNSGTVKGNVSGWAKGYVATAIANGLLGEKADFTKPAIRSELVEATYSAQQAIAASQKPAKASVKSAKAAGVSKVEVTLDRDVDTAKATFTLKKGTQEIALASTTWSADKKTATLTLKDLKLEGEYTVTLGGLAADDIGTASASFTAEKEVVKELKFSTASDTIAKHTKARVKFKAVNQYGENVSLNAGSFTVNTPGFTSSVSKDNAGEFVVTIDTTNMSGGTPTPGMTVIPVYIYENDSRVSIQQNFKLGTEPFIQKMELNPVVYPASKKSLSAVGEYVTIPVTLYDQFGNPMAYDSSTAYNPSVFTTPFTNSLGTPEFNDFDNDGFGELRVPLTNRVEKSEDYTLTVQIGGASSTTKISISSAKLATKIQFGTPSVSTLAEGDRKDIYIPILAYDADGNALSADDIVDSQNLPRINLTGSYVKDASGNDLSRASIETSGDKKGQIHIYEVTGTSGSYAFLTAYLNSMTGNNSYITLNLPITKGRVPDKLNVVTNPATKTVGGNSDMKFVVWDQHGLQLDDMSPSEAGNYQVNVKVEGDAGMKLTVSGVTYTAGQSFVRTGAELRQFNNTMTFTAAGGAPGQTIRVSVDLQKRNGTSWTTISNVTKSFSYVDYTKENLTYTVSKPTNLFAAIDSSILKADQKNVIAIPGGAAVSKFSKKIEVSAKDSAGNTVVLPDKRIQSVSSSVYNVRYGVDANVGYILGDKAGKSMITVVYKEMNGDIKTDSFETEVKADLPVIQTVTTDATATPLAATANGYTNAYSFMNLALKDQYGSEFKTSTIVDYSSVTGSLYYTVEGPSKDKITMVNPATGALTASGLVAGDTFTLKVHVAGQVKSTFVRIR